MKRRVMIVTGAAAMLALGGCTQSRDGHVVQTSPGFAEELPLAVGVGDALGRASWGQDVVIAKNEQFGEARYEYAASPTD